MKEIIQAIGISLMFMLSFSVLAIIVITGAIHLIGMFL